MIFDCFIMLNEVALLDLRLHELNDAVDYFVIVESNKTFSYQDKPLWYLQTEDRWKEFADKIIYVPVTDMPHDPERWGCEFHQRNAILRGLDAAQPEDVVMVSDIDEIWDKNCMTDNLPAICHQKLMYGYLNTQHEGIWPGTMILKKNMLNYNEDNLPQAWRNRRHGLNLIESGWHFSYIGGKEQISYKLSSFAHKDYDADVHKNGLTNIYHDNPQNIMVLSQNNMALPQYLRDSWEQYKEFIYDIG